jgi:zinc protease
MYAKRIKEKKFAWGAQVLVTHFPTKGSVSFVGSMKGGTRAWASPELARIHALMLLEGTAKRTKKDIQSALDSMAASLQFSISDERLIFSGRVRTIHLPKLLALVAECITEPSFPEAELEVLKQRELSNLALAAQDTRQQADISLSRMLFAKGHPNYDETIEESKKILSNIHSVTLRSKHASLIDRRTLVFSAAGDSTLSNVATMVEKYFKALPQSKITFSSYKKAAPTNNKKTYTSIPNKASIDYMLGIATGIDKEHKEYATLLLGIQVLGNRGFASRLMTTVREQEGLTYGVYGYLAGYENAVDGYICIWATFAPELFQKGRASIIRQVKLIVERGVTEEEVQKHRALFEARSQVQLSNSGAFASAAHSVIVDGKKISYLDEFPKKILKLKAAEVNRALKKYLLPNKLSEAAAGPVGKI